jgi:hypothetical protein
MDLVKDSNSITSSESGPSGQTARRIKPRNHTRTKKRTKSDQTDETKETLRTLLLGNIDV